VIFLLLPAEFIIRRRFAPARWRSHPVPQGEGEE
jgi:hypothetical protein